MAETQKKTKKRKEKNRTHVAQKAPRRHADYYYDTKQRVKD